MNNMNQAYLRHFLNHAIVKSVEDISELKEEQDAMSEEERKTSTILEVISRMEQAQKVLYAFSSKEFLDIVSDETYCKPSLSCSLCKYYNNGSCQNIKAQVLSGFSEIVNSEYCSLLKAKEEECSKEIEYSNKKKLFSNRIEREWKKYKEDKLKEDKSKILDDSYMITVNYFLYEYLISDTFFDKFCDAGIDCLMSCENILDFVSSEWLKVEGLNIGEWVDLGLFMRELLQKLKDKENNNKKEE